MELKDDCLEKKIVIDLDEYLLPDLMFEHDTGWILYTICSPLEVPYRAWNYGKMGFYKVKDFFDKEFDYDFRWI